MKKILSILGLIILIGTSTENLVSCNLKNILEEYTPEELAKLKEKNKINTANQEIRENLEWIAPQEKPFNNVDNKYYFVVWHGDQNDNWRLIKFKNNKEQREKKILEDYKNFKLILHNQKVLYIIEIAKKSILWDRENIDYIKSVYCWNYEEQKLPDLIVDKNGNIKVK